MLAMGSLLAGFVLGVLVAMASSDGGAGVVVAYLVALAGAFIAGIALLVGMSRPAPYPNHTMRGPR